MDIKELLKSIELLSTIEFKKLETKLRVILDSDNCQLYLSKHNLKNENTMLNEVFLKYAK